MKYAFTLILTSLIIMPVMALHTTAHASDIYCPALDDVETYKEKASYRYLIAGEEGWLFRSRKDLKEDFTLEPETIARFLKLSQVLKQQGKTLHIVMPPTRGVAHHNMIPTQSKWVKNFDAEKASITFNQSLTALKNAGLSVADFSDTPQAVSDHFYYKRDHHWSPMGAKFSAQETAALIKPYLEGLPTKNFQTEIKQTPIELNESFGSFVAQVCNIDIPSQTVDKVQTYATAEDLFDDETPPHIALIGTSNTTEPSPSYANFAGYMREFLQTDIENMSIQGAGIDSPIFSYFAANQEKRSAHKHLIWELASHYDFNGREFDSIFKQIIPAAAGACKVRSVVDTQHTLTGTSLSLLPADKKSISSQNRYVHFDFSKPVKKEFVMNLKFTDKTTDRFKFKRSSRYPHDGIFFLDLSDHGDKEIEDISILFSEKLEGVALNFQICDYQ